ncbi:helix-turn-helix domain-containing protein [Peribacillus frigoritolerans]|uniref:helix-turn-helix domain-containing protein n=1 Tax=Peribacillus frigoritolerans TaxID=450367 RepID=UPI0032B55CC4
MNIYEKILAFFNTKYIDTSYQIWIRKPLEENFNLAYKQGKEDIEKLPLTEIDYEQSTLLYEGGDTYLSFSYLEDYQVIVCVLDKECFFNVNELDHLYLLFYCFFTHEMFQVRENELEKLMEGMQSISSSLDLDELLTKIVGNALAVITAVDAGYLQLYDAEIERLVPSASVGFNQQIQYFKTKIGEGITGKVFMDGKARVLNSNEEVINEMFVNNMSNENLFYISSSAISLDVRAIMCVPVSIGSKRIGIMIVHQYDTKRRLTERDLNLLQGFADQAAVAIENARLYTKVRMSLEEVTKLSNQLKERNQFLLKRNEVHETLTKLSLQNEGVQAIIMELNRMLDTQIVFADFLGNEFYFNKPDQIPPLSIDEISILFFKRQYPVYIDVYDQQAYRYFIYPIINRTVFLGCLIITLLRPLSHLERITIEQGSSTLALELAKQHTLTDVYYKKTHEYFTELLEYKEPELLLTKGKELGLNMNSIMFVTLFKIRSYQDLQVLEAIIHRLVSIIKQQMARTEKIVYGFHNKVTLLISLSSADHISSITKLLDSIIKEWNRKDGPPLSAGIGNSYYGVENIRKSYDEAGKALSYLTEQNRPGMIRYGEIGLNRFFLNQKSEEIERFLNEIFSPLWSHKAKKNELEKTLLVYTNSNRSAIQAAEKLHIHINTLYQRLKKIEEALNLSFNNTEDMLKIELACHLKRTFNA